MIHCPKFNFNFLRVPRCASESVAEFLIMNYAKPAAKSANPGFYSKSVSAGEPAFNFDPKINTEFRTNNIRTGRTTLKTAVFKKILDEDVIANMDNIAIIRNPYERQLSVYWWLTRGKTRTPEQFRAMMANGWYGEQNVKLQTEYTTTLNLGDIGTYWLFEDLESHIDAFKEQHGWVDADKPRHWKNYNLIKRRSTWTAKNEALVDEYYDQATRDAVQSYFEADFEKYNELKS